VDIIGLSVILQPASARLCGRHGYFSFQCRAYSF